ncbi:MAG: guanylate kinase [Sarcina sp.]
MIYVLVGKSSSGKDTLMRAVMAQNKRLENPVSYTSRPIRQNEVNGVDYNFLTKEQFLAKLENGELLEYREYKTIYDEEEVIWYYGLPFSAFELGKDYIVVIDFEGAKKLIANRDDVKIIYIDASDEVRFTRSLIRENIIDSEDKRVAEIKRRMDVDNNEFVREELEKFSSIIIQNNKNTELDENIQKILELM